MQSSMTIGGVVALFGAMVVLASVPSVSVFAVCARSAASGFVHGVFTTLGIVVGDIFWLLLAIFGLSVLAETMGNLFVLMRYFGGAYLMGMGIALWTAKSKVMEAEGAVESSLVSSFLAGLWITLGDQKAILFYLGFLPAFLDLSTASYVDASVIILIAVLAVGGVKLGYALMGDRGRSFFVSRRTNSGIRIAAGIVMVGLGAFIVTTA